MHTLIHTRTRAHTHTYIYIYTHTYMCIYLCGTNFPHLEVYGIVITILLLYFILLWNQRCRIGSLSPLEPPGSSSAWRHDGESGATELEDESGKEKRCLLERPWGHLGTTINHPIMGISSFHPYSDVF